MVNKLVYCIGIDPSMTSTGIYDNDGNLNTIKTTTEFSDIHRICYIRDTIKELISKYQDTHHIVVGIEGFSLGSRGRGVSKMFGIGWAIRLMLNDLGINYYEIPPTSVKKFATGKGNCDKNLILKEVFRNFDFDTNDNNIADAFIIQKIAWAMFDYNHINKAYYNTLKKYQQEVITKLIKTNI